MTVEAFAVYYGWPSEVNGAHGDVEAAVGAFDGFAAVVFGEGNVAAGSDPLAPAVVAGVGRRAAAYGYVDLGLAHGSRGWSTGQLRDRAAAWKAIGASGIFFDCAGADYGVGRARFGAAVDDAHRQGLSVIANAWAPDDALCGATPLRRGDGYLGENDVLSAGRLQARRHYAAKLTKMATYRRSLGITLYETATVPAATDDAKRRRLEAHVLGIVARYGVSRFQLTDPHYSSTSNILPRANACTLGAADGRPVA